LLLSLGLIMLSRLVTWTSSDPELR
jgi:hypothetical protein